MHNRIIKDLGKNIFNMYKIEDKLENALIYQKQLFYFALIKILLKCIYRLVKKLTHLFNN
jgi:hypothetical protein